MFNIKLKCFILIKKKIREFFNSQENIKEIVAGVKIQSDIFLFSLGRNIFEFKPETTYFLCTIDLNKCFENISAIFSKKELIVDSKKQILSKNFYVLINIIIFVLIFIFIFNKYKNININNKNNLDE